MTKRNFKFLLAVLLSLSCVNSTVVLANETTEESSIIETLNDDSNQTEESEMIDETQENIDESVANETENNSVKKEQTDSMDDEKKDESSETVDESTSNTEDFDSTNNIDSDEIENENSEKSSQEDIMLLELDETSSCEVIEDGKVCLNDVKYDSLFDAVNAVNENETGTIYLGSGTYTLTNLGANTKNKSFIFIGEGSDKTSWTIGYYPNDKDPSIIHHTHDDSFYGSNSVTFKEMTLIAEKDLKYPRNNSNGFFKIQYTTVENCVINGMTKYWGTESALFKNTIFNANGWSESVQNCTSKIMTFDQCTFKGNNGGEIYLHRDWDYNLGVGATTFTININNCTFNPRGQGQWEPFVVINDNEREGQNYIINFTGNNKIKEEGQAKIKADSVTCSRWFKFDENKGKTVVNIDETTVFTDGKIVAHEMDLSDGHRYTYGYETNNYKYEYPLKVEVIDGVTHKYFTKTCRICGYTETVEEVNSVIVSGPSHVIHSDSDQYELDYSETYTMSDQLLENLQKFPERIYSGNVTFAMTIKLDDKLTPKQNDDGTYSSVFESSLFKVSSSSWDETTHTFKVNCQLKDDWKEHLYDLTDGKMVTTVSIATLLDKNDFEVGNQLKVSSNTEGQIISGLAWPFTYYNGWAYLNFDGSTTTTDMALEYKLNFVLNGGSMSSTSLTSQPTTVKEYTFDIRSRIPTRSGYTFVGWASNAGATSSDIGNSIELNEENYEKTIYAMWQQNSTPEPTSNPDNGYTPCPDGMQWNEDAKVCEVIPTSTPTVNPAVVPANNLVNPGNGDNNPVDNTPVNTPQATTTPSATPTPSATGEPVVIEDEQTPLALNGQWSLVNLIASLGSILLALILIVSKHEKEEEYEDSDQTRSLTRNGIWKVVSGIVAIGSVVIFVLTENMRLKMVLFDKYSVLMIVLLFVNVISLYLGKKWHEADNQEEM